MTDQDQEIAMWQWMGWKYRPDVDRRTPWFDENNLARPEGPPGTDSLDVLHEMEKKLRGTDWEYHNDPVIHNRWQEYIHRLLHVYGVCATAPQRREALLRTLNLWKE